MERMKVTDENVDFPWDPCWLWTYFHTYFGVLLFYREVPMKEAKEFAESIAAIFIETSARNAVNVEELFQKISRFHDFSVCYIYLILMQYILYYFVGGKEEDMCCWLKEMRLG